MGRIGTEAENSTPPAASDNTNQIIDARESGQDNAGDQNSKDTVSLSLGRPSSETSRHKEPWQEPVAMAGNTGYPATPLLSYLDRLEAAVEKGNGDAAFHLYHAHRRCFNAPKSLEAISDFAEEALDEQGADMATVESIVDLKIIQFNYCEGFDAVDFMNEGYKIAHLGIMAARNGVIQAKLDFAAYIPFALNDEQDYVRHSDEITQHKAETMQHLREAHRQGAELALLRLSDVYREGLVTQQNPHQAYAYLYAYQLVTGDKSLNAYRDALLAQMPDANIEELRSQGKKYVSCCF